MMSDITNELDDIIAKHGATLTFDDAESLEVEPNPDTNRPPLEVAVEKAILALTEISIYGTYGRADSCATEANDALEQIKALKATYDEQNKIIDILSSNSVDSEVDI
jgi:hypothetical protein